MTRNNNYIALLDEMRSLHIRKNAGYAGDSQDRWANFRISETFGVSAFRGTLVRMSDKYIRIMNLVANPNNERVGESILDTLADLASYSLIAACIWEERTPLFHHVRGAISFMLGEPKGDPVYLSKLNELKSTPPDEMSWGEALEKIKHQYHHIGRLVDLNEDNDYIPELLTELASLSLAAICAYQEEADLEKVALAPVGQ